MNEKIIGIVLYFRVLLTYLIILLPNMSIDLSLALCQGTLVGLLLTWTHLYLNGNGVRQHASLLTDYNLVSE